MNEDNLSKNKEMLRAFYKDKREHLSSDRKNAAKHDLYDLLWPEIVLFEHVMSFVSWQGEIDMSEINHNLAKEGRLILPRVSGNELIPYRVTRLDYDLERSKIGVMEPKESCEKMLNVDCALVPGIGFDKFHHRLGYGKGFYDKYLAKHKKLSSYGVGYREQLIEDTMPREAHDIKLTSTFLV